MKCGNVKLCGVLVLKSGLGKGEYKSVGPEVHGLWPEIHPYGSSRCIPPNIIDLQEANKLDCYKDDIKFKKHEWYKHGKCSGTLDSTDYFSQICNLSKDPINIISKYNNIKDMKNALEEKNYDIYKIDNKKSQIYLTACYKESNKQWYLSSEKNFNYICN